MRKYQLKEKWAIIPLEAKVSISYAVCSIFQNCLGVLTLPLFTRLLTTEQYGQATIYASWASLLTIFITLQLPYGSFSRAMVKYKEQRDEYISSVEGICIVLAALFLLIYLPFKTWWGRLFELPPGIMVIMVLEILASSGIAFWSGKKRFEFKYKEVIAITVITSIISPILQYILVVNCESKGYARIIGGAIVNIIVGGFIFLKCFVKGGKVFDKRFWKYALGFNIPLLAYYLSQMIFNASDRIMISHMCGIDKAAVYGVAYNLAIMLNFVLSAVNNSYVPWFYEKLKAGRQNENKPVANAIAILIASLLLVLIWFAPEAIKILAGEEYAEARWIVPPVAMSTLLLFYAQLSINVEFFFEEKNTLVKASIGAALTNVLLNLWLIPIWGYYAAGYTTLFSYVLFAGTNYYAMRTSLKSQGVQNHGFNIVALLKILVLFIVMGFVGMVFYNYLIVRICVFSAILVAVLAKHKRIINYWKTVKGI